MKLHDVSLQSQSTVAISIKAFTLRHFNLWLATSSIQIKELWTRVSELLEQPPTSLQQEALDIPADASPSKE